MANYTMTPARRAALKKAQAASARKRRGTGKKRPPGRIKRTARAAKKEYGRKKRYAAKNYKGPGGAYKASKDRYNSTGAHSRNWRGKAYGKKGKRINKAAETFNRAYGVNSLVLGASYVRGRRAGTIKKKTKKGRRK